MRRTNGESKNTKEMLVEFLARGNLWSFVASIYAVLLSWGVAVFLIFIIPDKHWYFKVIGLAILLLNYLPLRVIDRYKSNNKRLAALKEYFKKEKERD